MLKRRDDILKAVRRHFDTAIARVGEDGGEAWPYTVALGRPSSEELANRMHEVSDYVTELRAWGQQTGFEVRWRDRRAGGRQQIPTHVMIATIDLAARMLGREAQHELRVMRDRAGMLGALFPHLGPDDLSGVLRATRRWNDVDFDLLVQAGQWFSLHDAAGLTPRQVPLVGFHAKWLNARGRRSLVSLLAEKDDLRLVEPPPSVSLAYLDPAYLSAGGRHYDTQVIGDVTTLPYEPYVALIIENQDTFRYFPPLEGGICIFGAGYAGAAHVRQLPWVARVPHLFYWGDIDADGLQILDAYRAQGLAAESILMDLETYRRYERFGTSQATGKQALEERQRKELMHLTAEEQELYQLLVSPDCPGHRRIEQERIPLGDACKAIRCALKKEGHEDMPH